MFFFYQSIISFIIILSPIIFLIRVFKNKEDPKRFLEKYSLFKKKRPNGNLVWFHCASVGETMSIIPIINYLQKNKKIKNILITTTTVSSANIIRKFNFKKLIHQYYPIDHQVIIKKFIIHWRPNVAFFLEAEIWPGMFSLLDKRKIPLIILNTRLSKRSFEKWMFFKKFAKNIFSKIKYAYPQNQETEFFLKKLNVKKINQIGNLKYIDQTNKKEIKSNKKILKKLLQHKTWVAASIHPGEEDIAGKAHLLLKKKHKKLILIIIPRHINNVTKIKNNLENLGLKVITHSSCRMIAEEADVYLVDTFGESKNFYKISPSVFLGKSIYHHGGQNPLEAVKYGCNILHGPNIQNFKDVYKHLEKLKISKKISSIKTLANSVTFKKKHSNSFKIKKIGKKIYRETIKELNIHINQCI